jgi:hypothetical protein
MMRSFLTFPKVVLLTIVVAGAIPACSTKQGPLLSVDVSLDTGVLAPATVQFLIFQGTSSTLLSEKNLPWPGGTTVKVALELPGGSAGDVTVTANGKITGGAITSSASGTGTIDGQPIALVLKSVPTTGADAGADALEVGAMGGDSQAADRVSDGASSDSAPAADLAKLDLAGPDVDAPAVVGTPDGSIDRPVDAGDADAHDGPVAVGVADAFAPDSAGDTPAVRDTAPAPVDTAVDSNAKVDLAAATRSWSTPLNLSGGSADEPSVAVAPVSGDAVVVWADSTAGATAVHYTAATDTWGKQVTVTDDLNLAYAQVAADAKGHYLMVWSHLGDGTNTVGPGLWSSFSSDGVTWSKPTQIFAGGGAYNHDYEIQVAMNRAGQAEVVWGHEDQYGMSSDDLYAVYVEGTAFQPAKKLATCGSDCGAHAAIDGSGNGIVVWSQPDPVKDMLSAWGATFAKQTMGTPQLLENVDTADVSSPTVAMNAVGQGMVIWQQPASSSVTDIYARRYSVTTGWDTSPERAARGYPGMTMALALNSVGTAELAWSNGDGTYQATVSSQAYQSSWATLAIETDDKADVSYYTNELQPQIALDGSDNALVGWRKGINVTEYAGHLRWRTNNTWGTDTEIAAIPDLTTDNMRLGASDDGRAVATWTHYRCDPTSSTGYYECPNAKQWDALSAEAKAAFAVVFVSVYR